MANSSSTSSSEYMIYHPEKLGLLDIISLLILRRRLLSSSQFVESNIVFDDQEDTKLLGLGGVNGIPNIITIITLIIQKILYFLRLPMRLLGRLIEFLLNLFSLNGGLFGLIFHIITCKLKIPKADSEDYRSILAHIDGRKDLYQTSSLLRSLPTIGPLDTDNAEIGILDLCIMSSKIAYENEAFIKNVVTKHWKMQFVGFYNFWNVFSETSDTQAFIFTDTLVNAKAIFVSFRGTEPFNAQDWSTDVDLSWLSMGKMGRVHLGFMKALGLQDDKDYKKGWPKNYIGSKNPAYYTIRDKLKALLIINPGARIVTTGHSLGGALAALFPSVLMLHQETDILSKLGGVYTYGQPRVGDKDFGEMMMAELNGTIKRYYRVVYRFDVVPRVPFDDPISQFTHFGGCIYFSSWYKGEVLKKQPNDNYLSLLYIIPKYFNAWVDLFRGIFAWIKPGKDFAEGFTSIAYRCLGLIIPGLASHGPRDYVNATRLAKITIIDEEDHESEFV